MTASGFTFIFLNMLTAIVSFLAELKVNNNLKWFHAHKADFLKVKQEFETELVDPLIGRIHAFDPRIGFLSIKDCTYRINRDIRFTPDKSPYKTWLAGAFTPGGKLGGPRPTYYFHLNSEGEVTLGVGLYMLTKEQLLSFREKIAKDDRPFRKMLAQPDFKATFGGLNGEQLIRIPRGFPTDHPAEDLLRYKQILIHQIFSTSNLTTQQLLNKLEQSFTTAFPLISYLRKVT